MTEHDNRILLQSRHTEQPLSGGAAVAGLLARQAKPVRRENAFRKTEFRQTGFGGMNRYGAWQNPVKAETSFHVSGELPAKDTEPADRRERDGEEPAFLRQEGFPEEGAAPEQEEADMDLRQETAEADAALTEAAKLQEELAKEQEEFDAWRTQETERLEQKHQKLRKQKRQMEQERKELDLEKLNFQRLQEIEEARNKKEEQLLEMKRQILEGELYKLAEEKRQFEQKKNFYDRVNSFQEDTHVSTPLIQASVFFVGVNSAHTLKKRYKDLLKIYHPDNKCGDTDTIQQINREYQRLLEKLPG